MDSTYFPFSSKFIVCMFFSYNSLYGYSMATKFNDY